MESLKTRRLFNLHVDYRTVLMYLQYDPMAILRCQGKHLFSHGLLTLAQRHIVEVVVVKGETKLPS